MINQGKKLKELMADNIVMMPGAFNPLVAKLIEKIGFSALYISGAALTAGQGFPDDGSFYSKKNTDGSYVFNPTKYLELAKDIVGATNLPAIVDIDTGFGSLENIQRAVRELEQAGAAGIQIEDQKFPKKCGHLKNKKVVDVQIMTERIVAARQARKDPDFLIIARTDVRGDTESSINPIENTVLRAHMYRDAGADIIFPEALKSTEEFQRFRRGFTLRDGPLLANMTEFGETPYITAEEFKKMGYQIIIFPVSALRVAMKGMEEFLKYLKENGTQKSWESKMQTRQELYALLGYKY